MNNIYNPNVKPYDVVMKTSNLKHIQPNSTIPKNPDNVVPTFAEVFNRALSNVNDLQLNSDQMQVNMITNPDSVDPHQVAIAQTKAELALSFTKAIVTRLINSYKELENLR